MQINKYANKKKIKIGVDFDGVLAYNPFRIVRAPVTFLKRTLLGEKKTRFYVPKNSLEKLVWAVLHESSIFPAIGASLLKELVDKDMVEAHLVTGRYSFLKNNLYRWLTRWGYERTFTTITVNDRDQQPHLYKERVVKEKKFDYFIEDNLDIVKHINGKTGTKMYWIYNILDRGYPHPHKFPYLEKALREIVK